MKAKVHPAQHASTCIVVSEPHLASSFVTSVRNRLRKHLLKKIMSLKLGPKLQRVINHKLFISLPF